jgi:hypothetical protein
MPASLFFPLDNIQPSQLLSQHSEWVYFTLMLVFFISVSGITLRKHFDKPYVKPLIISVGLMLTFGVFKYKSHLTKVFEGWGTLGMVLLGIVAVVIPYGLCRGLGFSGAKAFYVTFILFYILSWMRFPALFHALAEQNLGLINFALLILFVVSVIGLVKLGKLSFPALGGSAGRNPRRREIDDEIKVENQERGLMKSTAAKMAKLEIRSLEDIGKALEEISGIIETQRNGLQREERERISSILDHIVKDENIFKKNVMNTRRLVQRLSNVDAEHFRKLKERFEKTSGKEKRLVKGEIADIEEKLAIEQAVFEMERRLLQALNSFNQSLRQAMERVANSLYPYDAVSHLSQARRVLKGIMDLVQEAKALEERILGLIKAEKNLLKQELKTS